MEGTEVTLLWPKGQMGNKDLGAMNILMILKNIDWKGQDRDRMTAGGCRTSGKVVIVLLLFSEWRIVSKCAVEGREARDNEGPGSKL